MQSTQTKVIGFLQGRFTPAEYPVIPVMNLRSDLGFDSLDMMELVLVLETEFDISISDQEASEIDTVEGLARLIYGKVRG